MSKRRSIRGTVKSTLTSSRWWSPGSDKTWRRGRIQLRRHAHDDSCHSGRLIDQTIFQYRLDANTIDNWPTFGKQWPQLLRLTAVLSGRLINLTELGAKLGLNRITARRYLALLEQIFLVERIPAWRASEFRRLVKTPKMYAVDTGMMCALRGITRSLLFMGSEATSPVRRR